jgi:uncharacterized protein
MIVVSNTSPLTNLASIGRFDLLEKLYSKITIPPVVLEELNNQGQMWPGYHESLNADWISLQNVENFTLVTALRRDLDDGEAHAIALAIELDAELLLMDEREGRRQAQRFGLKVIGVVGLLLEAKIQHKITYIQPELDALRQQAGFYISNQLYDDVLKHAKER